MIINEYHKAVLTHYAEGEFAHYTRNEAMDPNDLGDTLLTFILIELSDNEDCESIDMGIQRMETARDDIDVVISVLSKLQTEMISRQLEGQI